MEKTIKVGQLVTVNNIVYRCKKADWNKACDTCDLEDMCAFIPFNCDWNSNFKRVATKDLPKTRRCKKLQNNSL